MSPSQGSDRRPDLTFNFVTLTTSRRNRQRIWTDISSKNVNDQQGSIRVMQIKSTVRYNFLPTRMATIKWGASIMTQFWHLLWVLPAVLATPSPISFLSSSLRLHLGNQLRMAQVLGPPSYPLGGQNGILGSWVGPGLATAIAGTERVKQQMIPSLPRPLSLKSYSFLNNKTKTD